MDSVHKMNETNTTKTTHVFNPRDKEVKASGAESGSRSCSGSCSCKKLLSDTKNNICCYCYSGLGYFIDFEETPLSNNACNTCNNACNGMYGSDDVRCCCFLCIPFTSVLDIISCPFRMCHYIHKKRMNGEGIPCYTIGKDVITSQP